MSDFGKLVKGANNMVFIHLQLPSILDTMQLSSTFEGAGQQSSSFVLVGFGVQDVFPSA